MNDYDLLWLIPLAFLASMLGSVLGSILFLALDRRHEGVVLEGTLEETTPAQQQWERDLAEARANPDKGEPEEAFGVTEFISVKPKPFNPGEWVDWPKCQSCDREPVFREAVYEFPQPDGGVKILCSNCGRIPTS